MTEEEKARLRKLISISVRVLCAGVLYATLFVPAGLVIPCPFHLLTGYNCPGCGVTRMCMALLHGDLSRAFSLNMGLFVALPAVAFLGALEIYRYIRGSRAKKWTETAEKWSSIILVIWFLLWGLVRNRYGI